MSTFFWNFLFHLSLMVCAPMWIIRIMAGRKCAPSARYFQALHGGKIVWTVKDDWSDGKISDHFMNLVHGEITDLSGHKLKFYSGGKIDFGNGKYTIVQIADRYEDFGINGLKDLLDADKEWHRKIKKGEI